MCILTQQLVTSVSSGGRYLWHARTLHVRLYMAKTTDLQMVVLADPVHLPTGRSGTALLPEAWDTCHSSAIASSLSTGPSWLSHADVVLGNKGGQQASKRS